MATLYPRINVRTDQEVIDGLDRLAVQLSEPGAELTRSDVARLAMLRGMAQLRAERKAVKPARAKGAR